jgi:SSS family transporter
LTSPRYLDLAVIAVYLVAITAFGARFRRSQKSLRDYFLASRTVGWWAISLSIVAAETSTLTIIGTPALAFQGNLGFLQLVCGYLVARVLICLLFIPHYFRGELFTAYELMRRRFGETIRRFTASTFLVVRALAEGVRVFAISIVISIVLGTGELTSIVIITLLTLFYTFEGGMTAVIWTDVVQMFLYVAGGLVSFWLILQHIPGGWAGVVAAAPAGKFQIFDFRLEITSAFFSRTYSFWAGLLCGTFLATGTHGTDQLIVQRLLSARSERESKAALLASGVVIAFQFTLFLLIGILLYVYHLQSGLPAPRPLDRAYPSFIWTHLPAGAAGLVVAAILAAAMSNLSAALNSLASTTIVDFYKPLFGRSTHTEDWYLRRSRFATVAWGLILLGIAILARRWGPVLEAGLGVISITIGALLGVFLLGVLTRRANEPGAIAGMAAGFATMLYLHLATRTAWTWYVVLVTLVTFTVGYVASLVLHERKA